MTMGNQQSHEKTKQPWLQQWTPEEQKILKSQFDSLLDGSATIPGFSKELAECLAVRYSKQNDLQGFAEAANKVKSTDESRVELVCDVFLYAVQQFGVSLEDMVVWVVQAGVPIWCLGSQIAEEAKATDDASNEAAIRLSNFLLRRAKEEQDYRANDLQWLEEVSPQKSGNDTDLSSWLKQASIKPSTLSTDEVVLWARSTPSFLVLFRLCAETLFLGRPAPKTEEESHRRRVAHQMAPRVKLPEEKGPFSRLMTVYDYFMLTFHLPANALSWSSHERAKRRTSETVTHELLFSSQSNGMSWQVFVNSICERGATLIVLQAKDGTTFGGYADETWTPVTDWHGNASNFLFRLRHQDAGPGVWEGITATGGNNHFQYLCWGKTSLPNGLGMGGQFDYAGLWLDSNFENGHSRAGPVCSTFQSPQLTSEPTFTVDKVEAWLVRPVLRDEDEEEQGAKASVFSRAEDMEFLEMAGKKMYSKDLGKPEEEKETN